MSKYKHLLFDVDGTLVDTYFANMDGLVELFNRHVPNHTKTMDDFAFVFGIPGRDGLRALGFEEERIPKLLEEWVELVVERSDKCRIFDNIIPVLSCLKDYGMKMAVVTSRTRQESLGGPLGGYLPEPVRPYIQTAVCAGDTPRPKPYPDPILHYMEMTGATRDEILFIGDAPTDLKAADAAGVDFALALWGYKGKDYLRCKHYLRSPWDIVNICTENDPDHSVPALIHKWAREINALSQSGLTYTDDRYDIERYERLRDLSCEMAATYIDESYEIIKKNWCAHVGYKTPQVETRAAIFDDQNRILLVKEKRNNKWSLPGGWCDDGLTIVENAVKEVREEAGMEVHVTKLIAVLERNRHNQPEAITGCLKAFLECQMGPGDFQENTETSERRFFAENELPVKDLRVSTNTLEQIILCFEAHKQDQWTTIIE